MTCHMPTLIEVFGRCCAQRMEFVVEGARAYLWSLAANVILRAYPHIRPGLYLQQIEATAVVVAGVHNCSLLRDSPTKAPC